MSTGVYVRSPFCRNGHDTRIVGRACKGGCKECKRIHRRTPHYKERMRAKGYQRKYGITVKQYEDMRAQQKGCCAVCQRPETIFANRLSVDHDHATGRVRGLLCNLCNREVISLIENFPLLFERAKRYLEKKESD